MLTKLIFFVVWVLQGDGDGTNGAGVRLNHRTKLRGDLWSKCHFQSIVCLESGDRALWEYNLTQ